MHSSSARSRYQEYRQKTSQQVVSHMVWNEKVMICGATVDKRTPTAIISLAHRSVFGFSR